MKVVDMPEPVLVSREEAKKLFWQVSPETKKLMDDLAAWRLRSAIMMADQVFGPPG